MFIQIVFCTYPVHLGRGAFFKFYFNGFFFRFLLVLSSVIKKIVSDLFKKKKINRKLFVKKCVPECVQQISFKKIDDFNKKS